MKLLLLEDDRDAREALAQLLALDDFTVVQAGSPSAFLAASANLDLDAVIFDLRLEGLDDGLGLALQYQTRRLAAGLAPARLICLTGSGTIELLPPTAHPVWCWLQKPADYRSILAALRSRKPI